MLTAGCVVTRCYADRVTWALFWRCCAATMFCYDEAKSRGVFITRRFTTKTLCSDHVFAHAVYLWRNCIVMKWCRELWQRCSGVNLVWNMGIVDPGKKIRFVQVNLKNNSIFPGKHFRRPFWSRLLLNFRFPPKMTIYSYILGKLFYFSWKITTFEHTSCQR